MVEPKPGEVIGYAYLWRDETINGPGEGLNDCPCVVVLTIESRGETRVVTVAPITHAEPYNEASGVQVPPATRRRLGLGERLCWILVDEINRFVWPGAYLRPVDSRAPGSWSYGLLPQTLFEMLKRRVVLNGRIWVAKR